MLLAAAVVVVVAVVVTCLAPTRTTRVGEALRAVRTSSATSAQRRVLASEAARRGCREVAEHYHTQADIQDALDRWTRTHRSPLAEVSNAVWQRWLVANEQPAEAAARYPERTPVYGLRDRELDDVGLETPVDEDEEYAAFVQVVAGLRRGIATRCAAVLGSEIEGQIATLSGLLAVARCAGLGGLATWSSDAKERVKFGFTTQAYRRCNGLF